MRCFSRVRSTRWLGLVAVATLVGGCFTGNPSPNSARATSSPLAAVSTGSSPAVSLGPSPAANSSPTPSTVSASSPGRGQTWGPPVLAFEFDGTPTNRFTFTGADGQTTGTVYKAAVASGEQGDGAGLVLFGNHTFNEALLLIARNGTAIAIPAAMATTIPPDATVIDGHTVVGMVGDQFNSKYELFDVSSGQVTTLLTVASTEQTGGIQPPSLIALSTSPDRTVEHVLIRHATVNGTAIAEWAVVDIDLIHRAVTGIRQIPLAPGVDPDAGLDPALSTDGRLFAYQEGNTADAGNMADYRTHIVDLTTGHDTVIDETPVAVMINSIGLRFSPDGTALIAYGTEWPSTGPQQSSMVAFATADGHFLSRVEAGSGNQIQPMGWIGPHTVAYQKYVTNSTMSNTATAHTIDVFSGGDQNDLPVGLGVLVAVLN